MEYQLQRENPIAVFDSGVGGISVLRELIRIMPEEDFIYDIDNIFLKDISCSDENRNEMILQMFVDAIPLIDAFAKTYLRTKGIHHLYSHFNKKYLSKLYDTDNANK